MSFFEQFVKNSIGKELLLLLIEQLSTIVDSVVDGKELTGNQVRIVKTAYSENQIWFKKLAKDTDTQIDDEVCEEIDEICEDLSEEGGFELPTNF